MDNLQTLTVEATPPAETNESNDPNDTVTTRRPRQARTNIALGVWIAQAEQVIVNAQNDTELNAFMLARGYTPAKYAEGTALLAAASSALNARQNALAEQKIARDDVTALHEAARREHSSFRIVTRSILQGDDVTASLLLDGRQEHSIWGFIHMAHLTYRTALERPDYVEALVQAGYTTEHIRELDAQIDVLAQAAETHRHKRADLRHATLQRDERTGEAWLWYNRFRSIARVAVRGHPELAARLNVTPL